MLADYLENKPLYYTEIDYTRMPRVYEKIKEFFSTKTKVIHLIGTNGKGTTGRFLATALHNIGYKTAHYTSPHILEFNERIWLNGSNASDATLNTAHEKLQTILSQEDLNSLSYFEYTTLLAMLVFNECEYVVLEAGLGGEHDATAVFPKDLTLVTPIDFDHEAFLGSTIKEIAKTKLNAVQNNFILSPQKHDAVYAIAKDIVSEKNTTLLNSENLLDAKDKETIITISKNLSLSQYLKENLSLSISALKFFKIKYSVEDFDNSRLFGRLSRFRDNILVDVGHNPLAAEGIFNALKGEKYTLIYNTYKDKEYQKILRILKPIILELEIIAIDDERIELPEKLQQSLELLEIQYKNFETLSDNKNYLVFGSFSVVERFLKVYNG